MGGSCFLPRATSNNCHMKCQPNLKRFRLFFKNNVAMFIFYTVIVLACRTMVFMRIFYHTLPHIPITTSRCLVNTHPHLQRKSKVLGRYLTFLLLLQAGHMTLRYMNFIWNHLMYFSWKSMPVPVLRFPRSFPHLAQKTPGSAFVRIAPHLLHFRNMGDFFWVGAGHWLQNFPQFPHFLPSRYGGELLASHVGNAQHFPLSFILRSFSARISSAVCGGWM